MKKKTIKGYAIVGDMGFDWGWNQNIGEIYKYKKDCEVKKGYREKIVEVQIIINK
jgi:hypothetical protein